MGALEAGAGLEKLRVEARGWAPEAALPALFEALEGPEPFLFVEAVDLAKAEPMDGRPAVSIRLRLAAYRLAGASE